MARKWKARPGDAGKFGITVLPAVGTICFPEREDLVRLFNRSFEGSGGCGFLGSEMFWRSELATFIRDSEIYQSQSRIAH